MSLLGQLIPEDISALLFLYTAGWVHREGDKGHRVYVQVSWEGIPRDHRPDWGRCFQCVLGSEFVQRKWKLNNYTYLYHTSLVTMLRHKTSYTQNLSKSICLAFHSARPCKNAPDRSTCGGISCAQPFWSDSIGFWFRAEFSLDHSITLTFLLLKPFLCRLGFVLWLIIVLEA